MRLKSVKLTHFRGYRATTFIPIDEAITGIVGRIDCFTFPGWATQQRLPIRFQEIGGVAECRRY